MQSPKKHISTAASKLARQHYMAQIRKHWTVSLPALILPGIANIFLFFAPPLILAKLITAITNKPDITLNQIFVYVGAIGSAWLLGEAIMRLSFHFEARAVARGLVSLYNNAMDELLKKDIDFFNNNFAGSLTKNVGAYARNYERFFDTLSFNIVTNLIAIIVAAVILTTYSWYLGILLIVMLVCGFFTVIPFIRKRRLMVGAREASSTHLTGHVADVIGNIHAVQSFGKEHIELHTHSQNVEDFRKKAMRSWDYHTRVVDVIVSLLYVITNIIGLSLVIYLGRKNGDLSTEAILVTFGFYAQATLLLFQFNNVYRNLETSLTDAGQFTEYLLEEPKIVDRSTDKLTVSDGQISLHNVTFAYPDDSDDSVFENLNLTIKPGEKVGLVGKSGSGKTTITKLLLRFMDIDSGSIVIDGQDIAHVTRRSLRQNISYVAQEPALFHRSLSDNIAYGQPHATTEQVLRASRMAHADEFIKELPHGYETMVGERGVKLSGGQRQRIAIARAMLKNAPILVLDEATSALDSESEVLIQDALWKLMNDKTAIVIAHRLSTIQKMDRIVVLDHGKIVEQGSHTELLKHNGTYAKLWAHQSGGFLED